ncbi:MAG: hypothetical protein ABI406_14885 [Ktedonobacteraceae bacterium]
MQRRPAGRETYSVRTKRTNPAMPGATLPTAPITVHSSQNPGNQQLARKRSGGVGRAVLWLCAIGVLIELLTLALYPLLANVTYATNGKSVTTQALTTLFPWLAHLFWHPAWAPLAWFFAHVPWLNPATMVGNANLFAVVSGLALVLSLFAVQVGNRVTRKRLERIDVRLLFCIVLCFTALFGLTYLFAPGGMTQDMFLYGFYGRMVTVYHVNPYVVSLASFPHDIMQQGLAKGTAGTSSFAPAWIDFSIPVTLLARDSIANIVLGFRALGLIAHILNSVLIWLILAKLRPQTRIAATLLYGWNPLALLLSVAGMHLEVVALLLLLCAVLFFQRKLPLLAWAFVLLSVLTNLFCLLLVPLFFRLLAQEARPLAAGRRVLWWLLVLVISMLLIFLAYVPYWSNWGISGIGASLQHTFLQDSAINSLDAALLNLPIKLPPFIAWLALPHHWTLFAAIAVACFLLLGLWLSDNLEFLLLFSSLIFLSLLLLLPTYWPEYALIPLALALCSFSRRTILLAALLTAGAYLSYYFWLWQPVWPEQGLVTIGLPLLIWGWTLFFLSTWEMLAANNQNTTQQPSRPRRGLSGFSRPSLPSRPSWPGRRQ